jgi:signal transduction histidine kinase
LGVSKDLSNNLMDLTYREIQEMASNLDSSANNVYKLLENLLQWAKMQRGLIDYNPENCNLKILVKQNYDLISEFALLKQIKIEIDINESLEIFVDIAMLNTVIRNVITNAIKFTNAEGKIIIKAVDYEEENNNSNSFVLCSISDSGIGMSKFILENLFRIDQNVSREGTDGESSSGLGLLLCKEFVEKNHGKMWAESIENQGSTFYFTIPKPIS